METSNSKHDMDPANNNTHKNMQESIGALISYRDIYTGEYKDAIGIEQGHLMTLEHFLMAVPVLFF